MERSKEPVLVVREAFDRWSAGEGSLNDLLADDAEVVIPGTLPHCGVFTKSAFVRDIATPFMARFSEAPAPRAIRIWADGDDVVVLADAEGTRGDGAPYANRYVFILEMRAGRIVTVDEAAVLARSRHGGCQRRLGSGGARAGTAAATMKRWVIDRHGRPRSITSTVGRSARSSSTRPSNGVDQAC